MPAPDADRQGPGNELRLVRRPALVELLERGAAGRGTVISAPPGSGKKNLLGAGRETTPVCLPCASVRRDEPAPRIFWASIFPSVHPALPPDPTNAEPVAP